MPQSIIRYKLGSARRVGEAHLQPETVLAELRIIDPNCTPEWLADAIRMGIVTASTAKPERPGQPAPSAAEAADNRAAAEATAREAADTRATAEAAAAEAASRAAEAADTKVAAEAAAAADNKPTTEAETAAATQSSGGSKRPAKGK